MAKDNPSRARSINSIRDDVWGLLMQEAEKEGRAANRQLEKILEERYQPESLGAEEIKRAIKIANENKRTAASRSKKGSRKNGTKR